VAISIDWATSVISVQKSDMVLIQSSPTEIYQLDMDVFRLTLKDLEDDEVGMAFVRTHNHNPPVTVSGAVLARVVEILAPYTVTFEDGQYRVQVVGANTNIGERTNVNQVSVSTSNSAGLQDLNSLQAASFNGGVTIDTSSQFSGTTFPIGTRANPVNNINDAISIAQSRGIFQINVASNLTITNEDLADGYTFVGNSPTLILTLNSDATISNCTFQNLTVQGTLDNVNTIRGSNILNLVDVNGFIFQCAISGTISLGGGAQTSIFDCYSGVAGGGAGQTSNIDLNGASNNLVLRNFSGGITLSNTGIGVSSDISIDMNSGRVLLDSSLDSGDITIRGVAKVVDNSNGATINDETLDPIELRKPSFINGAVYLDASSSDSGTIYPLGSAGRPVNNLADALTIANANGLTEINLTGFITATASNNLDGINFIGGTGSQNVLNLNGCSTVSSSFERLIVYGTLNGSSRITNCTLGVTGLGGFTEVEGRIVDCIINTASGVIQKTTGAGTLFDNCSFIAPNNPQITLDANGKSFSMRDCTGNILITNKTDAEENQIQLIGATVEFDSTCTAGGFIVEGTGQVVDNSGVGCTVTDHTINRSAISTNILETTLEDTYATNTVGNIIQKIRTIYSLAIGRIKS
jgi:hypothetical protein